jgi:cysteine-rich repeat protein
MPVLSKLDATNRTLGRDTNRTQGELQQIVCESLNGTLSGAFTLTFNGETTIPFDADTISGDQLIEGLNALSTIGDVGASAEFVDGKLTMLVEFALSADASPLNWGVMPWIEVNATDLVGLVPDGCNVTRWFDFVYKDPAIKFAERSVTMNATVSALRAASIRLGFQGNETAPISPLASATEVRLALSSIETIGEIEVFRTHDYYGPAAEGVAVTWRVRFYPPMHLGPQPPLTARAEATSRRRLAVNALGLAVVEVEAASSPLDLAIELGVGEPTEAASEANTSDIAPVKLTPVVHICGNGKRSSAEACDDNNTVPLDGCDALCKIEVGWSCARADSCTDADRCGSSIGALSRCTPICGD